MTPSIACSRWPEIVCTWLCRSTNPGPTTRPLTSTSVASSGAARPARPRRRGPVDQHVRDGVVAPLRVDTRPPRSTITASVKAAAAGRGVVALGRVEPPTLSVGRTRDVPRRGNLSANPTAATVGSSLCASMDRSGRRSLRRGHRGGGLQRQQQRQRYGGGGGGGGSTAPAHVVSGGTFTFALSSDPGNLDPQASAASNLYQMSFLAYDPLLAINAQGQIQSQLATKWQVDGNKVVLDLAQGHHLLGRFDVHRHHRRAEHRLRREPEEQEPVRRRVHPGRRQGDRRRRGRHRHDHHCPAPRRSC